MKLYSKQNHRFLLYRKIPKTFFVCFANCFSNIHNCFNTSFIVSLNCILFQWIEVCFKFNNCFTDLLNFSFNSNIVHPELKFVSMKRLMCQNSNNCFKQIEDCWKANFKRCIYEFLLFYYYFTSKGPFCAQSSVEDYFSCSKRKRIN